MRMSKGSGIGTEPMNRGAARSAAQAAIRDFHRFDCMGLETPRVLREEFSGHRVSAACREVVKVRLSNAAKFD
jgi:hypothetical protein